MCVYLNVRYDVRTIAHPMMWAGLVIQEVLSKQLIWHIADNKLQALKLRTSETGKQVSSVIV